VFSDAEVSAIAAQLKGGTQPSTLPLNPKEISGTRSAGATVALRSVRDIANVNALLTAQELTFHETGVTAVYGDNASGKSGYARVIKSVAAARHHGPVHPNVFAPTTGAEQTAQVAFVCGGVAKDSTWPQDQSPELRAVSFYDEACGDAYIGGDTELTYRPSALVVLDRLIDLCDRVSEVLGDELRENQAARLPLPPIPTSTHAGRFLSNLSGETTDDEIDIACVVAADANTQLSELIKEEARLTATDPARERLRLEGLATTLEALSRHVVTVESLLTDQAVTNAVESRSKAIELRVAADMASSGTFETEPLPGVGSETWRELWDAARRYSLVEAYHDQHFPVVEDEARCPLCQQQLSSDAADRLGRFQKFMADTTAQDADAAEQSFAQAREKLQLLDPLPSEIATQVKELEFTHAPLAKVVTDWIAAASARKVYLTDCLDGKSDAAGIPALGQSPQARLLEQAATLRAGAASLDTSEFQTLLEKAVTSKDELQARITLSDHREQIKAEVTRLAERASLESARRLTETGPITRKSTELTEQHVTRSVRDRFTRESDRLKLERIELKRTGGQKGKFRHRPALLGATASHPVEEVLSEGEQTALGLAGYFTEAYFDESRSALVLDDPVTSLDHRRRNKVARRLAQFAKDRQVIVFTHDLEFLANLRQAANTEQVTFTERCVQRQGGVIPGLCIDEHPWKAKDVGRRLNELETELSRIKRERANWDEETYERECSEWAGKLSETWERVINLDVIHPLVDPDTSEVRPRQFRVLAKITDQDDREFQQSYSRISTWVRRHDKSPAVNYVAPDPSDLESEIALVRAWFDRVKKYRD
jgi:energy-coupling factor transporter ATP-binding protein EcfA2